MTVRFIDKIQVEEVEALSSEPYADETQFQEKKMIPTGLALHQVFNQDLLETPSQQLTALSETSPLTSTAYGFWNKLVAWWQNSSSVNPSLSISSEKSAIQTESIQRIPVLKPPTSLSPDLLSAELPLLSPKKMGSIEQLSQRQIDEGIALMSSLTFEKILFVIFKAQLELEKENAVVAEGTFSKYQKFKKLHEQFLQEIKEILAKDEKIAGYFNTAQTFAMYASFVSVVVAAAVTFTLLPAWVAIATSAVTASATGLTTASKSYFQRRLNEDKAKHETFDHKDKYYNDRVEDARRNLMSTVEMDQAFKERLLQLLKRFSKMSKIVLAK